MRCDDPTPLPSVRSSAEWVAYFRANAGQLLPIPWEIGAAGASPEELAEIAGSLAGWQLGETSDGSRLLAAARHHATSVDDPDYVEAIRLFTREEQRHGADLGRFLVSAGVPLKGWDSGDAVFRLFRHLFRRIEVWVTVVILVEVHALLYYAAVRRATGSTVLRRVCDQILRDEVPHVRFQCERLAMLRRGRSRVGRALTAAVQRVLFTGTTLAIWAGHRRALRAGGYTFRRFWSGSWAKMRRAWAKADPRAYRWETEPCGVRVAACGRG